MVNPCMADKYLDYMVAARTVAMQLTRARGSLAAVPDIAGAVGGWRTRSPGTDRLRGELSDVGTGIKDAAGRVDELIAYLNGIEAKYQARWHQAEAERERLAKESRE